ncbi:thermonuclease family protein [Thermodesulfobacteriota bacterium]
MVRWVLPIIACAGVLLMAGEASSQWSQSPRYALHGKAEVVEVNSPNLLTLKMLDSSRVISVRLLGVGSPHNRDVVTHLDPKIFNHIKQNDLWEISRNYVQSLVKEKVVEVWVRRWNRCDEKNRLLVYLKVPGLMQESMDLNAAIIKNGLGFVTRDYVHVTYVQYRRLQDEARNGRRGIWRALREFHVRR